MISRRNGLWKLGATASAWLVCSAACAAAASVRSAGEDLPRRGTGPGLPDDGRAECPLCSRGLECRQHLA